MAFSVKLNGNNYVSEKTRAAFEQALQDGPRVHLPHQEDGPAAASPEEPTASEADVQPGAWDYSHVLESLERGLAQSYEHQRQTLQVHEQYLRQQGDYAQIFAQLMQQQHALFANGDSTPERLEAALTALEHLSRSIDQFHEYQAQTLHVHNEFLSQQAAYAQAFMDLLRKQSEVLLPGNGSARRAVSGATTAGPASSSSSRGGAVEKPATSSQAVRSALRGAATSGPTSPSAPRDAVEKPATLAEAVRSAASEAPAPGPASLPGAAAIEQPPAAEAAAPSAISDAPTTAPLDLETLTASLLEIVSDKTGYPAEMLDLGMDMEADLGIDSIKRVEILSALQDRYPALPQIEAQDLVELHTLGQIMAYLEQRQGDAGKKA